VVGLVAEVVGGMLVDGDGPDVEEAVVAVVVTGATLMVEPLLEQAAATADHATRPASPSRPRHDVPLRAVVVTATIPTSMSS
jgi:hypothetical protein